MVTLSFFSMYMLIIATAVVSKFLFDGKKAFIIEEVDKGPDPYVQEMLGMIKELQEQLKQEKDDADFEADLREFAEDMQNAASYDDEPPVVIDGEYEEVIEDTFEEVSETSEVEVSGSVDTALTNSLTDSFIDFVEDLEIVEDIVTQSEPEPKTQYDPREDIENYDKLLSYKKSCYQYHKDSMARKKYWNMLTKDITIFERRKFLNLEENAEFRDEVTRIYKVLQDVEPSHPLYSTVVDVTSSFNKGRDQSRFMEVMSKVHPFAVPTSAVEVDGTVTIEFMI